MNSSPQLTLVRAIEVNNARNQTRDEIVNTFVKPSAFEKLLTPKNHIILGSRGSGKTATVKMLSHSHLSLFEDELAKKVVASRELIGLYVPARLSFLGSQIETPPTVEEGLEQFVWKVNLATAFAFVDAAESCLRAYFPDEKDRAAREGEIVERLYNDWNVPNDRVLGLSEVNRFLSNLDFEKGKALNDFRLDLADKASVSRIGSVFHMNLFDPLKRAIEHACSVMELPATVSWLVCLDELEFLEPVHHKLINSHMRADSGRIYLKCTTLPFKHLTRTTTTSVSINEKHDFEYIYLDRDITLADHRDLIRITSKMSAIYDRRMQAAGWSKTSRKSLSVLLGASKLIEEELSQERLFPLIEQYCNVSTIERAKRLRSEKGRTAFGDQMLRKLAPALRLRDAVKLLGGREELDIYSGAALVTRCSDGNPRLFLAILWRMLAEGNKHVFQGADQRNLRPIAPNIQNKVLLEFSRSELQKLQSEENGQLLHKMIYALGRQMRSLLHDRKLGTDFVSSFSIQSAADTSMIEIVKEAVGIGCVFPAFSSKDPDRIPEVSGDFRLGFKYAPVFQILPRKGKSIPIGSAFERADDHSSTNLDLLADFGGATGGT